MAPCLVRSPALVHPRGALAWICHLSKATWRVPTDQDLHLGFLPPSLVFFSFYSHHPPFFIISEIVFLIQRPVSFTVLTREHCKVFIVTFWHAGARVFQLSPVASHWPSLFCFSHTECSLSAPSSWEALQAPKFRWVTPPWTPSSLPCVPSTEGGLSVGWEPSGVHWVEGGRLHPSQLTSSFQSSPVDLQHPCFRASSSISVS